MLRLLAYVACAAAAIAAYLTVPIWGFLLAGGSSLGFIAINEWLRKKPSAQLIRRLVSVAYFLTAATALGTLFAGLPPPAFWVVSAMLPAWQAQRLSTRRQMKEAVRMLGVAFGVYAWVLVVALWLPILLSYR